MSRRVLIGYVEIEAPEDRLFRMMVTGNADVHEPRAPKLFYDQDHMGTGEGRCVYWCAADKPPEDIHVKGIYRTTRIPKDAACEDCHIPLRELQASMTEIVNEAKRR